jgi:hypothetical protein
MLRGEHQVVELDIPGVLEDWLIVEGRAPDVGLLVAELLQLLPQDVDQLWDISWSANSALPGVRAQESGDSGLVLVEIPRHVAGRKVQQDVHPLESSQLGHRLEVEWRDPKRIDERQVEPIRWDRSRDAVDLDVAVALEHVHASISFEPPP